MSNFDPYRIWLGIPPHEQPPNYYRLLGLSPFESDVEVIANAADRQMAHLRTFQGGKNSAISQKILNEVAAARICLLDPVKRQQHDVHLRAAMQQHASPTPPQADLQAIAVPPVVSGPMPIDHGPGRPGSLEGIAVTPVAMSPYYPRRRKKNRWQGTMVTLTVMGIGLLVAIWLAYMARDKQGTEPTAKQETRKDQTAQENSPEKPSQANPQPSTKPPSKKSPSDPAKKSADTASENEKYGKRLCFMKGNWSEGLPKLAASANEELKTLAEKELSDPKSVADRLAVADGWWAVSERYRPPADGQLRRHAVEWYKKVIGDLDEGSDRDRAEWRIAQESPLMPGEKRPVNPDKLE